MTIRTLLPALCFFILQAAPAATVLTNFPGAVATNSGVKGTGGAIPIPIEYGFEFTVGGGNHDLITISLEIGTHLGNVPLSVELYSSPAGPDTATFLTAMTGQPQPINQVATNAPSTPHSGARTRRRNPQLHRLHADAAPPPLAGSANCARPRSNSPKIVCRFSTHSAALPALTRSVHGATG